MIDDLLSLLRWLQVLGRGCRRTQKGAEGCRRGYRGRSWLKRLQDDAEERRRMQEGAGGAGVCLRMPESAKDSEVYRRVL
jgi:hypothetical protein